MHPYAWTKPKQSGSWKFVSNSPHIFNPRHNSIWVEKKRRSLPKRRSISLFCYILLEIKELNSFLSNRYDEGYSLMSILLPVLLLYLFFIWCAFFLIFVAWITFLGTLTNGKDGNWGTCFTFTFSGDYCSDILKSGRGDVNPNDIWQVTSTRIGIVNWDAFHDDWRLWIWLITWFVFWSHPGSEWDVV